MRHCSKRNKRKVWKETYGIPIHRRQRREAMRAMILRHWYLPPEITEMYMDYSLGA